MTCAAQMPAIQGSQAPLERTLLLGRLTFPSWSYQVQYTQYSYSQAPLERTLLLGRLTFPSWSYQVQYSTVQLQPSATRAHLTAGQAHLPQLELPGTVQYSSVTTKRR